MRPNSLRFSSVKSRLILSSVDKWLTKICIKKPQELKINHLRLKSVPRTELQILQLATLNYTYKYPVLQLITKYNCEFQLR